MRTAGVREAGQNLSAILDEVKKGGPKGGLQFIDLTEAAERLVAESGIYEPPSRLGFAITSFDWRGRRASHPGQGYIRADRSR